MFIYVDVIATGNGIRYDVGADGGLTRGLLTGSVPGFVAQQAATLAQIRAARFTYIRKIASHSALQHLAWQGAVRALPVDVDFLPVPYSLIPLEGTFNCVTWTIGAAIAAKAAERIKF